MNSSVKGEAKGGGIVDRRKFLAATGAAALGVTILNPKSVRAADANGKLQVALIGCGGRGNWIADLFVKHGGYKFIACHDYFEDKTKAFAAKHQIEASKACTGLKGYLKVLENKDLDAIIIISPPYFHPEQAAAGIEAGKHVYLAKPIAVDVPGCATILETGKKATEKKLACLIDFQTRTHEFYCEAIKRVHNGDIGKIVSGEAAYYCGPLGNAAFDQNNAEARLRNWSSDRVISGDVITEQNIHALDVAAWVLDENAISAVGKCGKKARGESVTCNSCWSAIFTYSDDITLTFASKQCGDGYDDIGCKIFGARGTLETHYGGNVSIRGQTPYKGGATGNIYTSGAVANIATFHDSVTNRKFENPTIAPSVRSNLTTILGRTACYKRAPVTWEEMMKANEKLEFDTKGMKE